MTRRFPVRRLDVYRAQDGWRWRLKSSGRVVADSGQAYTRRADCAEAARNVLDPGRVTELRVENAAGRMVPPDGCLKELL